MKELEKLRVLLPHWIEHNDGHGVESSKWADIAREAGEEAVAGRIDDAVRGMAEVSRLLNEALEKAGGPLEHSHHHDHHHHHDHD
ncbi:MAG: hypothetical protein ABFS19_08890 [Thermodesulfobacteriota bacterium]